MTRTPEEFAEKACRACARAGRSAHPGDGSWVGAGARLPSGLEEEPAAAWLRQLGHEARLVGGAAAAAKFAWR
jgi:hypothetical protein